MLKNTKEKFGLVTRLLHWSIFILFCLEFYLVYRREYFPEHSEAKLQYILLHKSFGLLLLLLALCFILWSHLGTRPPYVGNKLENFLSKSVHRLLFLVMLLQPLTGIFMSLAGGYNVGFFNVFTIAHFAQKYETLGFVLYQTHVWTSYAIIGLVGVHASAALFHQFIRRDGILRRML